MLFLLTKYLIKELRKKKKNIDLHAGKEEKINGIKSYKCSGWLL
jgi:hypothetical protein